MAQAFLTSKSGLWRYSTSFAQLPPAFSGPKAPKAAAAAQEGLRMDAATLDRTPATDIGNDWSSSSWSANLDSRASTWDSAYGPMPPSAAVAATRTPTAGLERWPTISPRWATPASGELEMSFMALMRT